jgi:hypothetical protein
VTRDPLWFRLFLIGWIAFILWLAFRYQPPALYTRTRGQRRQLAMMRPVIASFGIAVLVMALWP